MNRKTLAVATLGFALLELVSAPLYAPNDGPQIPIQLSVTVHATQAYTSRQGAVDNSWPNDPAHNLSNGDLEFKSYRATPAISTTDSTKMSGISADFASGAALVLLKNNNIGMDINGSALAGAVSFAVFRDVADSSTVGTGNFTLVPANGQTPAKMTADKRGSFFLVGYVDSNPANGRYDAGETSAAIPVIIVEADLYSEDSQADNSGGRFSTRVDNNNNYTDAGYISTVNAGAEALRLTAKLNLYGGGSDGKRGTDRVYAGWTQQVQGSTNPLTYGTYSNGSNSKTIPMIYAHNVPVSKYFLPGNQAPNLIPLPLLDSGDNNTLIVGSGGGSILVASPELKLANSQPSFGRRIEVKGFDTPQIFFKKDHPAQPLYLLNQVAVDLKFRICLTLWTSPDIIQADENGIIVPDPSDPNLAGERTYFDAYTYDWHCGATYNVTADGDQGPGGIGAFCDFTSQHEFSPISPADGSQREHETRSLAAKSFLGFDATQ